MATFASVTAAVGSGYWWESDWTVYIDDGQGERRPFDEFTGWWQAVESGFVGAVAGWAVVAACAYAWLFWSLLARGVPDASPAAAADAGRRAGSSRYTVPRGPCCG